jgi:hypothetical protein
MGSPKQRIAADQYLAQSAPVVRAALVLDHGKMTPILMLVFGM